MKCVMKKERLNTEPSILLPAPHTTASISPAHPNIALGYMPSEFCSVTHEQAAVQWDRD